ncbi:MAG: site-specific integrase [Thiohalomonadaceae bacterium]|jgi:integrase
MASFYKRGDYQWEAKIRRKGFPSLSKTFETRQDAETWALQVEAEMKRGTFVSRAEAERTTLRELIHRYIEEVTPTHKGAASEQTRLAAIARSCLCDSFVANLRPADFAAWRDLRLKSVAPATVVRELGMLQQVITHAMREWEIVLPANPVKLVKRPKVANARARRLQLADPGAGEEAESEEERLLAACSYDPRPEGGCRVKWLRPIVELAIETAMRRGELLALEWRHIDLESRVAFLPDTKNGHSRHVPLSPKAVAILEAWSRDREGRVFDITENAFKLAWQRAVKRAGLPDLHFHDLRHEAASRLAEKLTNILELSSVTGHLDLRMLKRYYHPRPEELARKLAG